MSRPASAGLFVLSELFVALARINSKIPNGIFFIVIVAVDANPEPLFPFWRVNVISRSSLQDNAVIVFLAVRYLVVFIVQKRF